MSHDAYEDNIDDEQIEDEFSDGFMVFDDLIDMYDWLEFGCWDDEDVEVV